MGDSKMISINMLWDQVPMYPMTWDQDGENGWIDDSIYCIVCVSMKYMCQKVK